MEKMMMILIITKSINKQEYDNLSFLPCSNSSFAVFCYKKTLMKTT